MARVRGNQICVSCSEEQKAEVERKADEAGLSVSNYLRRFLGWPLEQQGKRKDLKDRNDDQNDG